MSNLLSHFWVGNLYDQLRNIFVAFQRGDGI